MHVTGVLLDLDGTLVDHATAAGEAVQQVFAPLAPPSDDPTELGRLWVALSHAHYAAWCAGAVTYQEQGRRRVRALLTALDAEVAEHDLDALFAAYVRAYEAQWRAFPDALPALQRLRAAGVPVAVLTNGDADLQRRKCATAGLLPWCGEVLASSALPAPKPDGRAFAEACRRLGCPPARTLMVGDDLDLDVAGARAAGLQAVLLDRRGTVTAPDGVAVWRSLDALQPSAQSASATAAAASRAAR